MLAASFCALMMVAMVWMMVAPMVHDRRNASRETTRDDKESNASV